MLAADETQVQMVVDCQCKAWEQQVVPSSEVPEYMRQKGIISQYRPVSCFDCALISIVGMHNETVNIWTHLFGMVTSTPFCSLTCSQSTAILLFYDCMIIETMSSKRLSQGP